ncbi:threonine/serine exporter family protein [Domibacillus epiphyticus]|uniref:Threonine/Serine exporter ThrE domain-containing protein n=1 Tax=Domibacillus epiphyticus TaxID=1714355 RepID=A0A1V2A649_9BACI|nr:threonine/serine exporter family protein [Domibacillus epiphyticus]OMP66485.1 hypothetical protein BTO28_12360 [Domibacillus epiphyticus]
MTILYNMLFSFVAAASFGIMFNVPKNLLVKCGTVGMAGWMVYFFLSENAVDSLPSTVAAAFTVAVIGHLYARMYKTPVIIFTVAGIIPLVPGGTAYRAMRAFVQNDYGSAVSLAAKAFMISGSIALGLVLSDVFYQVILRKKVPAGK